MKPIYQTILTAPDGNCVAACIASILELPLETVPNFIKHEDWFRRWADWLASFNLTWLNWPHQANGWQPHGYSILGCHPHTVEGLPGDWEHAVVALGGRPVWNPHPGYGRRIGPIGEYLDWTIFQVLDPARPITLPRPAPQPASPHPIVRF